MKLPYTLFTLVTLAATTVIFSFAQPTSDGYNYNFKRATGDGGDTGDADIHRRESVKAAFIENLRFYERYAVGKDKLKPLSKTGINDGILAGFQGTIVDSLSTQIVMGLNTTKLYRTYLNRIKAIDFTTTIEGISEPGEVSLFEMTIR